MDTLSGRQVGLCSSAILDATLIHCFRVESVADHSYRMAIMCMFPPATLAPCLDTVKCLKMSLFHDLAESVVGDITPADNVAKDEKHQREVQSMEYIEHKLLDRIEGSKLSNEIESILVLWREFEKGETLESRFVQDIDKLEMLLQMLEYEKRNEGRVNLREFAYAATKIHLDEMKKLAEDILKERKEFWIRLGLTEEEYVEGDNMMKERQDRYYGK